MTHGHPSGYLSAGALSCLICHLINGKHIREALSETLPLLEKSDNGEETLAALTKVIDLSSSKNTDVIEGIRQLGEGWTGEEALAIAVYAVLRASSFQEAVTIAANHDGDSDTTASIAGQLYGAWYGVEPIPEQWIKKLDIQEIMESLCKKLVSLNNEGRG
jgi:ADP-ribosylglycohydrolase